MKTHPVCIGPFVVEIPSEMISAIFTVGSS